MSFSQGTPLWDGVSVATPAPDAGAGENPNALRRRPSPALHRTQCGASVAIELFPEQVVASEIIRDGHIKRALVVFL